MTQSDLKVGPGGPGKPHVLLLPGTLCDSRVFASLAALLPGRDLRIAQMTGARSTTGLASAILSDAPARFVAVGFSLGGIVALEMACSAPDRFLGLVLIACSARPIEPGGAASRRASVAEAGRMGISPFVLKNLWPRYVGKASGADATVQSLVLDMAVSLGHAAFAAQTEVAIGRADSRPRLAALKFPVLVLGGEDDAMCPPALLREVAEALPSATLHIIANAGHFVLQDSAEAAPRIAEWLNSLACVPSGVENQ